jgi:hypothetical protein
MPQDQRNSWLPGNSIEPYQTIRYCRAGRSTCVKPGGARARYRCRMSWRYAYSKHIARLGPVDGGQCVRLVQHFIPEIGHTSTWEKGELVIASKLLMRGLAIANFDAAGNWPGKDHGNHAAILWDWGGRNMETGHVDWIEIVEQWVGTGVQIRRLWRKGATKRGEWRDESNNADAFWIIEQKGQPHVFHESRSRPPPGHDIFDPCPDRNEGEAVPEGTAVRSDRWPGRGVGR